MSWVMHHGAAMMGIGQPTGYQIPGLTRQTRLGAWAPDIGTTRFPQ